MAVPFSVKPILHAVFPKIAILKINLMRRLFLMFSPSFTFGDSFLYIMVFSSFQSPAINLVESGCCGYESPIGWSSPDPDGFLSGQSVDDSIPIEYLHLMRQNSWFTDLYQPAVEIPTSITIIDPSCGEVAKIQSISSKKICFLEQKQENIRVWVKIEDPTLGRQKWPNHMAFLGFQWRPRPMPALNHPGPIFVKLISLFGENFPYHLFSILCSICFVHTFHFNILPPCFDNWFHDVSAIYSLIVHNLASMFDHSCPIKITILQPTFPWSCPRYVHHRYLVVHPT